MKTRQSFCMVTLSAGIVMLAACNAGAPAPTNPQTAGASSASSSSIDKAIDHALKRAEVKLTTEDISVSDDDHGLPEAKITPQGDFLIAGKPVALSPAQRAEVLAYRQQLIAVGEQGIAIGKRGAALGMSAAGAAIAAVFSGESEQQVRKRVEAKASGIREAAANLCDRMPALRVAQQKLAAALPAFRPYATLTQQKIDDCRTNALKKDDDND